MIKFMVSKILVNLLVIILGLSSLTVLNVNAQQDLEKFTIIVLPDTQYYSDTYPWIFDNQTKWIAENRESRNIVFVTHLGDLVDHWWSIEEWENANTSMSKLEGLPFGVLPGNHDGIGTSDGLTNFNNYFGFSRFKNLSWYGGAYQNINTNNYQLFSAGGEDYLIFHIQFNPSDNVLFWAGDVIDQYPNRRVIVSTHNFVHGFYPTSSRSHFGRVIWKKLVEPHADQIFLVLSGHYENEVRITSLVEDNFVYQLLSDYQGRSNGGDGWLRIIEFFPSIDEIAIKTYSPYLNKYETDSNSQFILDKKITDNDSILKIRLFLFWVIFNIFIVFMLNYFFKKEGFKKINDCLKQTSFNFN